MFVQHIKIQKVVAFFLILLIMFKITNITDIVKAAVPWVTIEGGANGIQQTEVRDDKIIQTGIHNSANDNSIRYRTLYFKMTIQKYNIAE